MSSPTPVRDIRDLEALLRELRLAETGVVVEEQDAGSSTSFDEALGYHVISPNDAPETVTAKIFANLEREGLYKDGKLVLRAGEFLLEHTLTLDQASSSAGLQTNGGWTARKRQFVEFTSRELEPGGIHPAVFLYQLKMPEGRSNVNQAELRRALYLDDHGVEELLRSGELEGSSSAIEKKSAMKALARLYDKAWLWLEENGFRMPALPAFKKLAVANEDYTNLNAVLARKEFSSVAVRVREGVYSLPLLATGRSGAQAVMTEAVVEQGNMLRIYAGEWLVGEVALTEGFDTEEVEVRYSFNDRLGVRFTVPGRMREEEVRAAPTLAVVREEVATVGVKVVPEIDAVVPEPARDTVRSEVVVPPPPLEVVVETATGGAVPAGHTGVTDARPLAEYMRGKGDITRALGVSSDKFPRYRDELVGRGIVEREGGRSDGMLLLAKDRVGEARAVIEELGNGGGSVSKGGRDVANRREGSVGRESVDATTTAVPTEPARRNGDGEKGRGYNPQNDVLVATIARALMPFYTGNASNPHGHLLGYIANEVPGVAQGHAEPGKRGEPLIPKQNLRAVLDFLEANAAPVRIPEGIKSGIVQAYSLPPAESEKTYIDLENVVAQESRLNPKDGEPFWNLFYKVVGDTKKYARILRGRIIGIPDSERWNVAVMVRGYAPEGRGDESASRAYHGWDRKGAPARKRQTGAPPRTSAPRPRNDDNWHALLQTTYMTRTFGVPATVGQFAAKFNDNFGRFPPQADMLHAYAKEVATAVQANLGDLTQDEALGRLEQELKISGEAAIGVVDHEFKAAAKIPAADVAIYILRQKFVQNHPLYLPATAPS